MRAKSIRTAVRIPQAKTCSMARIVRPQIRPRVVDVTAEFMGDPAAAAFERSLLNPPAHRPENVERKIG